MSGYNMVKVFSATKARDREVLGEKVTEWIRENKEVEVVDTVVRQSSDNEFHCISITVFGVSSRRTRRGRK